jgi:hypothetical protein
MTSTDERMRAAGASQMVAGKAKYRRYLHRVSLQLEEFRKGAQPVAYRPDRLLD